MDRLPPAGAARRAARALGERFDVTYAGEPGRGVGGGRVLDRAVVAHRSRRRARHPQVLRVARTGRARSSPSTSTTAGSSRTPSPACPAAARARGPDAARLHAASTARSSSRTRSYRTHETSLGGRDARGRAARPRTTRRRSRRRERRVGVEIDGEARRRASRRPRASSSSTRTTLRDWGWPEYALPAYIRSHVHRVRARPRRRASSSSCRRSGCRR